MDIIQKETLDIKIPPIPRPTLEELKKQYSWVKSIERDASHEKEVTFCFGSLLESEKRKISGKEYEKRLPRKGLLGFQHAKWLVQNQNRFPAFKELVGKVYVDFPGLIVVREGDDRGVFFLGDDGERWSLFWRCLSLAVLSGARVAFSGKPELAILESLASWRPKFSR